MKTLFLLLPVALLTGYSPQKPAPIELKGYFTCQASLVKETGGALACYAASQHDCQRGNVVLAYEQGRGTAAGVRIVDTVQVQTKGVNRWVSIVDCTVAGGKRRQYFALFKKTDSASAQYLHHLLRVWGVSAQGKLVEVPAKTVKCLRDDYGA